MNVQLKNYGDLPSLQRDLAQLTRDSETLRQRALTCVAALAATLSMLDKKKTFKKSAPGIQIEQIHNTLQELNRQSYLVNNIVAALRCNMPQDMAQAKTLHSALELQRIINNAWWQSYQQLSKIGQKYTPNDFNHLLLQIEKNLLCKLSGRYHTYNRYITVVPSLSGLCFIGNMHFVNLYDDDKYCWDNYWLSIAHDVGGYGIKTFTGLHPPLRPQFIIDITAKQVLPTIIDHMVADNFHSLDEFIFKNDKNKLSKLSIKSCSINKNIATIEFTADMDRSKIYKLLPTLWNELSACADHHKQAIRCRNFYNKGRRCFIDLLFMPANCKDGQLLYKFNWNKLTDILHLSTEDVMRLQKNVE